MPSGELPAVAEATAEMENYTYAGLVALLERVIADHDPALIDGQNAVDPLKGARADAARKRSLVEQAMERHGVGLLLSVGQHLDLAIETPASTALKRSSTPAVLAGKFMRLEGYHHSSHRTAIETRPDGWTCNRSSRGRPATDGENCLIAGLLLGLVTEIGCKNCCLEIGGGVFEPEELAGASLKAGADTTRFRISWTPMERFDDFDRTAPDGEDGKRVSDHLVALFSTDIGRSWKIADAARRLALSERTMQRRLSAEARSFSSVLRQARVHQATVFLTNSDASLAEIGYCCGYSDQAHFQRDFLRAANVTPREFRRINRETEGLG